MLGIDHCDDRIEQVAIGDEVIDKEGLRNRPRLSQAGGLNHHSIKCDLARLSPLEEAPEHVHQVTPNGATEAAVVHLHDPLLPVLKEQFVIDALGPKLVLNDSDALAVLVPQDAFEKGCLSRA